MLALVLILLQTPLPAQPTSQKVEITADRVEISQRDGTVSFKGAVTVTRGDLTLTCETLTGRYKNRRLTSLTAVGHVRVQRGELSASSQRATYHEADQRLVLSGAPRVQRGDATLNGQNITIWLSSEKIVIDKPVGAFDLSELRPPKQTVQ